MKKNDRYFGNVNPDVLKQIDLKAQSICEFGCGTGALANAYKALNPDCHYVGVELIPEALAQAEAVLDVAIVKNLDRVGDWSLDVDLQKALPLDSFDYMIFGDVLEHLYDPAAVLAQAVARLKPGGRVVACIPNVQHWSSFAQLLIGSWPQQEMGLFDKTHIRWFTLSDMLDLFTRNDLQVLHVQPRFPAMNQQSQALKQQLISLLQPAAELMESKNSQEFAIKLSALQYVIVGVKS